MIPLGPLGDMFKDILITHGSVAEQLPHRYLENSTSSYQVLPSGYISDARRFVLQLRAKKSWKSREPEG